MERFLLGQRVQDRCRRDRRAAARLAGAARAERGGAGGRRLRGGAAGCCSALGATFGDLVDSFYLDAFLGAGLDESGSVIRGGGLRGGSFAVGEDVFRLNR